MKIAILGSATSSLHLAPFAEPDYKIWACSPGTYANLARCDAFFELHRWEPGQIGKAHTQKPWFSPEYVMWMAQRDPIGCPVWMYEPVPEIRASRRLPIEDLTAKFGTYFFTSSIAIMIACAIDDILEAREERAKTIAGFEWAAKQEAKEKGEPLYRLAHDAAPQDEIGLFGVDMAANEEYGYQRAGCQHFLLVAADLGIKVIVPPESDLLRPMPIYGIVEHSHWFIKMTKRREELNARLNAAQHNAQRFNDEAHFLRGALDDLSYQMQTWGQDREGAGIHPSIMARSPGIRAHVLEQIQQPAAAAPPPPQPVPASGGAYTGRVNVEPKPQAKPKPRARKR